MVVLEVKDRIQLNKQAIKDYVFCSWTSSNGNDVSGFKGNIDYWIVRTDSNGVIKWAKCFGGSNGDNPYWIETTNDGGIVVAGHSWSTDGDINNNIGNDDVWIIKLDDFGSLVWAKNYGGSSLDVGCYIQQTIDNGFIVSGLSASNNGDLTNNNGIDDVWIIKLNPFTGIEEINPNNNSYSVFPNPSTDFLNIKNTNNDKIYSVAVLDIIGRKVLEQKENTSKINIQSLEQGIYFLKIYSNEKIYSSKFIKE